MNYYVYMMANWNNKVLYIGVTRDLRRRVYEHKNNLADGFTKRYKVHKLVYFDSTTDPYWAIDREKQLKGWRREKKNKLVDEFNPQWQDLWEMINE